MSCITKIAAAVLNACDKPSVGGLSDSVVLINYEDYEGATITYNSTNTLLVENIVLPGTTLGYKFEFVDDTINATSVYDIASKTYTHSLLGMLNVSSADIKKNLNDAVNGRFVGIVTNRTPEGSVKFEIYGSSSGMKITQVDKDSNANSGNYQLTMASTEKSRERYAPLSFFKTDIPTTIGLITGLLS